MAYRTLEERFKRLSDIGGALAVLEWDHQVMMPRGGNETRAEQVATLRQIAHEILSDARMAELLGEAEVEAGQLDAWQRANLREMRRAHARATALDPALIAALARATARAEMTWRDARPNADFPALAPALAEVVRLTREEASAKAKALDLAPYDALLDGYEPGLRAAQIDALLEPLAAFLPDLLEQALACQKAPLAIEGPFDLTAQTTLGRSLMAQMGFDFERGRLDESTHPFCGGVPDDVRLTARYEAADVTSGLMAILHETGHALYSAGLPKAWRHQPVGEARGMVVHESQSLLIEMQVCRSPAFLGHLAPLLAATFGRDDPALSTDNLYRRAIHVERGYIRVDADEVTYPLHVLLRYRLEKAMLEGGLEVAELPGAWNEGMQTLLGLVPPDDRLGCLQDIHWPIGALGYFPCYTLGAMAAAQLFQAASAAEPEILPAVGRGDFAPLLGWLRANIHEQGSLLDMPDLLTHATGRPLELQPFLDHLRARYAA